MIAVGAAVLVCGLAALVRMRTQRLSRDFHDVAARLSPARAAPIDLTPIESLLRIGENQGPDIDESAMVRVLGEMAWFPTAFRDRSWVQWSLEGSDSARATLRIGGRTATAVFEFGPDGMPAHVRAERFRVEGSAASARHGSGRLP